jgi:hypothetical protein
MIFFNCQIYFNPFVFGLVLEAVIKPFTKLKAHWSGIIAYFESKVTNGILEGINAKIQLAKRRARGYRNTRNFINMIYPKISISALIHSKNVDLCRINARYFAYYKRITITVF